MNRRDFIKLSAISGLVASYPAISFADCGITIRPSGRDDTDAINAALRASARTGDPAVLAYGDFTITNTITVPSGGKLVGRGRASLITFNRGNDGVVVRIEEPQTEDAVAGLVVEDKRSPVPFIAAIGRQG